MTPYCDADGVVLYCADCRDILPPTFPADAVITDPPYGLDFQYGKHDDNIDDWFGLMDDVVPLMRRSAPVVVMPSCAINRLPWWYANHPPDWLIAWYKGSPGHAAKIGFNDWEPHLVWGRPHTPMHDYFQTTCGFDPNGHPCPKPIEWARWLVSRCVPPGGVVIDPFAGSGTVLVAAKELGRRAVGIEIDDDYCQIARRRLMQGVLPL